MASRYDPADNSYHNDMEGNGVICSVVDILPTEFAKEASQHFGDILLQFIGSLVSMKDIEELPANLRRGCISYRGVLTSLYDYIPQMRNSDLEYLSENLVDSNSNKKKYTILVSLSGHLFDQFLINEVLDVVEAEGGSFHMVKCEVGQSKNDVSYSTLEVSLYLLPSLVVKVMEIGEAAPPTLENPGWFGAKLSVEILHSKGSESVGKVTDHSNHVTFCRQPPQKTRKALT
ncbi:unnamed protein product [Ilex paraguariensis]|uniref:LOR/SDH bifunctional enzyme conserved domain-containing protein n=1 Tax=Ilex paraguariensis TaxID=185542 RepID=A0ABC8RAE8_9AQUA